MRWHKDPEVEKALIRLIDALCTWERNTFRGSTLIFFPDEQDENEKLIIAVDGKPIDANSFLAVTILDNLKTRLMTE